MPEQKWGFGLPDQAPVKTRSAPVARTGRLQNLRGDLAGGVTSALTGIPVAMGYGMLALSPLGTEFVSQGVLAGLYAVICGGIVALFLGANTTIIFGPRSIVTYLIAALVIHTFVRSDNAFIQQAPPTVVLTLLFLLLALAGTMQMLLGILGLGRVVRYIPAPVMAGFQNAAAILIFFSQLPPILGFPTAMPLADLTGQFASAQPLTLLVGVFSCVLILHGARITRHVPPTLLGLGGGIVLYYLLYALGQAQNLGPVIGDIDISVSEPHYLMAFADIVRDPGFWSVAPALLSGAASLAIVASLDALLCARLVESDSGHKFNGGRELLRLGAGNVVSAAFGGIANGINLATSFANHRSGARSSLSIAVNAGVTLTGLLLLPPLIAHLPRVAIAAVLLVVAIQLADRWTLQLIRKLLRGELSTGMLVDLLVIVAVTAVAIFANIVIAVGLGVVAAIAFFIFRMSRSVIRRSYRCDSVHSRKAREERVMALLASQGRQIMVIELEGPLFFGSADNLAQFVDTVTGEGLTYLILDLKRVNEIDSTGARILLQIHDKLTRNGRHLLLAGLKDRQRIETFLHDMGVTAAVTRTKVLEDADHALEWAEDHLILSELEGTGRQEEFPFRQLEVFSGFAPAEIEVVTRMLETRKYQVDEAVFREGDPGRELFIIAKGSASVYLRLPGTERATRLITFSTGTLFGEVALLDDEVRSATIEADSPLVCYVLGHAAFESLTTAHPELAIKLLRNLARELSGRLRRANRTIYQLAS